MYYRGAAAAIIVYDITNQSLYYIRQARERYCCFLCHLLGCQILIPMKKYGPNFLQRDPSIRHLTSRHVILSGRITAHWFSGLLGSYLRWIQLITCLLLSRCYVTSSITFEQMYTEMASRHRVCYHCIQIIKTTTIPAKLCKRESTEQFHNSKIKFPLVFKKVRPPTRKLKTTYKASRPNLFV